MEPDDYQQIRNLFEDYLRMYASRDDRLTGHFSDDFSGFTGGGQHLVKRRDEWVAITRQDFAQVPDPLRIELKDLAIQSLAGTVAVATGFFHIHLPIPDHVLSKEMARLVLIFHLEPAGWKISHSSISIPYHLVREGEVYPLKGLEERNQYLEEQITERTRQLSQANAELQRSNEKLEREIAGHMRTEEALRTSEERFRQLAELFPETIFEADIHGRLTYTNEHGAQKYGFTPERLEQGIHLSRYVAGEDRARVLERTRERLAGLVGGFLEFQALREDGTTFDAMAYSAPILRQGRPVGIRGFILDVSERRRAEREKAKLESQLQHAQKMDSLGSLAGGVAHDMNNVLAAILGMATANQPLQEEGSQAHRAFELIAKAAARGGKMVQTLLNFARQSPTERREINLNDLLHDQIHFLERTTLSRVRVEVDAQPDLRPLVGDPNALTHAVMNLFLNAVEAMPEGGVLAVRTRNLEPDAIELLVEDSGTGMAKDVLAKAMDPFFTTKAHGKGTGIGLSMVYKTVKAHGGDLELDSEPGRGTRVRMRFPGTLPADPLPADPKPPEGPDPSGLQVLLVDDDDLVQSSMQAILGLMGHKVTSTHSGEAALAELEAARPDVVILDLNMPGIGGAETLRRLRRTCPGIPVLLATGRADQVALDLVAAFPGVTLMSKPFSLGELQAQFRGLGQGTG
jgi:PAS domain S-box-containing protein